VLRRRKVTVDDIYELWRLAKEPPPPDAPEGNNDLLLSPWYLAFLAGSVAISTAGLVYAFG
jgi:hypothetical protein